MSDRAERALKRLSEQPRSSTARVIRRALADSVARSSGMAASAGRKISGRQRQIDSAVDAAVGRMRNAQSTDSNNP